MSWATGNAKTVSKEENIQNVKEALARKEKSFKTYDAVMERTYNIDIKNYGSGMDIYLKGEVNKHFGKNKTAARCSIIRTREEILAMMDTGYFDVPSTDNPILIIKPNKTEDED